MPGFAIDPLLVTTPPLDAPIEELQQWLRRLEGWLDEVDASPFEWRHFLACTYRLQEVDRFPTFQKLREMARARGLDVNVRHLAGRIAAFFLDEKRDVLRATTTQFALLE